MAEPVPAAGVPPGRDDAPAGRDDAAVEELLAELNGLLEQVEAIPGPSGELALAAVSALADVYGEALARTLAHAAGRPDVVAALTGDALLGHLFGLHGIHPDPPEGRITRALDALRPRLGSSGTDVGLVGITGGVAELRLPGGCGAADVEAVVRETVLAVAPELTGVRAAPRSSAAFVPLGAIGRRSDGVPG